MSGMGGFYGSPYHSLEPPSMDHLGVDSTMGDLGNQGMDDEMMGDGLDEIINQNNQEMQRRRTLDTGFTPNGNFGSHNRRASMMEFTSGDDSGLADFGFDPAPAQPTFQNAANPLHVVQKASNLRKARSKEDLNMNPAFQQFGPVFDAFQNASTYSSPVHTSASMNMPTNTYLPNDLAMDYNEPSASITPVKYSTSPHQPMFSQSPMTSNFPSSYMTPNHAMGGVDASSDEQTIMEKVAQMSMPGALPGGNASSNILKQTSDSSSGGQTPIQALGNVDSSTSQLGNLDQGQGSHTPYSTGHKFAQQPWTNGLIKTDSGKGLPSEKGPIVQNGMPNSSQYPNAYSSSGFDMLGVLIRVAGRRNPEINIGPVDMSCAFVVCDISQHDLPIVYCSEVFERLTGYSKHEILGRNCRFLQAPDGKVQAGIKRKYVDDKSVLHLKNKIAKREEVQLSLINYRKGGQPFMNLLTMIPVQWDSEEFKYYVGFQVDLVEQPGSVAGRNPDGSYTINYQRGQLPRYIAQTPENQPNQVEFGQTIGRDEVSTVLSTIASGESELSKRIWDKVLLENTDDVVHVLSLKGLFLYLSPACRKVLEYDASELVGTALSSVCHPSDIVPVTRELKDTSSGSPINVVFRIRRKYSGYTWFESHGALHTEQGKGRKCIILVGRERPVYALTRPGLEIGDSEVWAKISTSGMILFVASNVRLLLDRTPEDLIGTSIQALMRPESRLELGRALEQARMGKRTSFKHDLQNRRGQILQAQTFLFPGDAEEGSKPTFLVAQTKLMKLSRMTLSQRPQIPASPRTDQASAGSMTPAGSSVAGSRAPSVALTVSTQGGSIDKGIMTSAGGEALTLGNQDDILASEDNIFDELKTTRSTSWQFELRQMEKQNRILAEELQGLISRKKKRKRRKGAGQMEKDCANCHTRVTPEWRRGPSGNRDLCNSCGLRWAKQNGRVSPRKSVSDGGKTPSRPSEFPDQPNKDRSKQQHQAGANVPLGQASPLPSGNREQLNQLGSSSGHQDHPSQLQGPETSNQHRSQNQNQNPNHYQNHMPPASTTGAQTSTASAIVPNVDSHIAKTAKFADQNLQGSVADRHNLPMKIDEDDEPSDDDSTVGDGDMPL